MTTSFSLRTLSRDDILPSPPGIKRDSWQAASTGGASVSFMPPFAPQTAITFSATHCRQRGGRGAHCAGRLRRGGTSRWHRATHHQSTGKPAPSSGCRQIIGSPKCPPPGHCPGVDERAGAHCPAGKEDGAGAGHGDRQRGGTVLCPLRLEKVGEFRAMR